MFQLEEQIYLSQDQGMPDLGNGPDRDKMLPKEISDFIEAHRDLSVSPISTYKVSAVGQTKDRELVPGVNIEFPGTALNESIHGEQTVVAVAHARGYESLDTVYLALEKPCGHCRQVLRELDMDLDIWVADEGPKPLSYWLPESFGPGELGINEGLLSQAEKPLEFTSDKLYNDPVAVHGLEIASRSHAPYTEEYAGVVFTLKDDRLVKGAYLENAAYNPTLSPFHSASANLIANFQSSFDEIAKVTLVTVKNKKVDHLFEIKRLLSSMDLSVPIRKLDVVLAK